MTKISSREFNQDVGRAKRAAEEGPVVITDRGAPAYVLLTYAAYRTLTAAAPSILDLLDQKSVPASEEPFEAPVLGEGGAKRAKYG